MVLLKIEDANYKTKKIPTIPVACSPASAFHWQ